MAVAHGLCRHTEQLDEWEVRRLIRAQLQARGEPIAEDELQRIASWVNLMRVGAALFELMVAGETVCRFPEGAADPVFYSPVGAA